MAQFKMILVYTLLICNLVFLASNFCYFTEIIVTKFSELDCLNHTINNHKYQEKNLKPQKFEAMLLKISCMYL